MTQAQPIAEPPPEILPPVRAGERETLEAFLDYFRGVLIRKAEGLTEEQVRLKVPPSDLDLLGIVRHLALVEQWWFHNALEGVDDPPRWADNPAAATDEQEWQHLPTDTMAEALAALREEIARSKANVARHASLDDVTAIDVGPPDVPSRYGPRSVRWLLVHMIEEYARHCGHADFLREAADGTRGD